MKDRFGAWVFAQYNCVLQRFGMEEKMIREINETDFDGLMRLYSQLHHDPIPERNETVNQLWSKILCDSAHHIIVAEEGGKILSSCALELLTEPGLLLQVQKAFHKAKGIYTAAP